MQRIPGLKDEDATGTGAAVLAAAKHFLGRPSNLTRILAAHSPYLAQWFLGLVCAVRQPDLGATTDIRLRNLATIKTSMANECAYCTAHTSIYGQALGLSEEELIAMQSDAYKTSPLFSERDKAVIAWAEAMTLNTAKLNTDVWKNMRALFNDTEIVEISLNCAMFNMINRLNDSFWTELEPTEFNKQQGNALKGRSIDQLEAYAANFAKARQEGETAKKEIAPAK